jgi:hypothetical protein
MSDSFTPNNKEKEGNHSTRMIYDPDEEASFSAENNEEIYANLNKTGEKETYTDTVSQSEHDDKYPEIDSNYQVEYNDTNKSNYFEYSPKRLEYEKSIKFMHENIPMLRNYEYVKPTDEEMDHVIYDAFLIRQLGNMKKIDWFNLMDLIHLADVFVVDTENYQNFMLHKFNYDKNTKFLFGDKLKLREKQYTKYFYDLKIFEYINEEDLISEIGAMFGDKTPFIISTKKLNYENYLSINWPNHKFEYYMLAYAIITNLVLFRSTGKIRELNIVGTDINKNRQCSHGQTAFFNIMGMDMCIIQAVESLGMQSTKDDNIIKMIKNIDAPPPFRFSRDIKYKYEDERNMKTGDFIFPLISVNIRSLNTYFNGKQIYIVHKNGNFTISVAQDVSYFENNKPHWKLHFIKKDDIFEYKLEINDIHNEKKDIHINLFKNISNERTNLRKSKLLGIFVVSENESGEKMVDVGNKSFLYLYKKAEKLNVKKFENKLNNYEDNSDGNQSNGKANHQSNLSVLSDDSKDDGDGNQSNDEANNQSNLSVPSDNSDGNQSNGKANNQSNLSVLSDDSKDDGDGNQSNDEANLSDDSNDDGKDNSGKDNYKDANEAFETFRSKIEKVHSIPPYIKQNIARPFVRLEDYFAHK